MVVCWSQQCCSFASIRAHAHAHAPASASASRVDRSAAGASHRSARRTARRTAPPPLPIASSPSLHTSRSMLTPRVHHHQHQYQHQASQRANESKSRAAATCLWIDHSIDRAGSGKIDQKIRPCPARAPFHTRKKTKRSERSGGRGLCSSSSLRCCSPSLSVASLSSSGVRASHTTLPR